MTGSINMDGIVNDDFDAQVNEQLRRMRVRAEAQRQFDDETRPKIEPPPVKSLPQLLAEPDTEEKYRIDRLAPAGGRVLLSAQYKAGKTITVGNLIRALADGHPFLGQFTVHKQARRIVLIDDELSENNLRRWLRDHNIRNTAAVVDVVALRGNLTAFNLLDDKCRDQWVQRLRDLGCDYLILDCLRPILDALGLDENRDAGRFLVAFDELTQQAGIGDSLTVHHMGHSNERSRGDSRLQDWPDAIWRILRETEHPDSARYFSAYGRDVNVAEGLLTFDPATRHLTYAAGSRKDAKTEAAFRDVIELLADHARGGGEGLSKNAIESSPQCSEHTQKAIRDGIGKAVAFNLVTVIDGPRNAKLCRIAFPCAECGCPVTSGRDRHQSCSRESGDLFE
jgi:hypothetical protein